LSGEFLGTADTLAARALLFNVGGLLFASLPINASTLKLQLARFPDAKHGLQGVLTRIKTIFFLFFASVPDCPGQKAQ
jgi:hypothetical protein